MSNFLFSFLTPLTLTKSPRRTAADCNTNDSFASADSSLSIPLCVCCRLSPRCRCTTFAVQPFGRPISCLCCALLCLPPSTKPHRHPLLGFCFLSSLFFLHVARATTKRRVAPEKSRMSSSALWVTVLAAGAGGQKLAHAAAWAISLLTATWACALAIAIITVLAQVDAVQALNAIVFIGPHKTGSSQIEMGIVNNVDVFKTLNYTVIGDEEVKGGAYFACNLKNCATANPFFNREKYQKAVDALRLCKTNIVIASEGLDDLKPKHVATLREHLSCYNTTIVAMHRSPVDHVRSYWTESTDSACCRLPSLKSYTGFSQMLEEIDLLATTSITCSICMQWNLDAITWWS